MLRLTQRHELPQLTRALRDAPHVAIDTEFHAERRYVPRIYLLQLHVPGTGIFLLDPLDPEVIPAIADALRSRPWVVHAGRQDLRILGPLLGGVPDVVWDTQILAGLLEPAYPSSYSDLVATHVGAELPKGATLSDWSRRPLSDRQLEYAAGDVRLLLDLWKALVDKLDQRGRMEVARAACADARAASLAPPDFDQLWRDLPAASALDPQSLAVLRALCRWREEGAIEQDQPVRSVLADGLLVDIARRKPTSIGQILANRRFPKRVAQRVGDEIIARVHTAASACDLPRHASQHSDAARLMALIALAMDVEGARQGWSQRLVVPTRAIEDLVLDDRRTVARHLAPWQATLAGSALEAVLDGSLALTIRDARTAIHQIQDRRRANTIAR